MSAPPRHRNTDSAVKIAVAVPGLHEQFEQPPGFRGQLGEVGGELVEVGGRLYLSRQAVIERVETSPHLSMQKPMGAMYAFIKLNERFDGVLDDRQFAQELLEQKHVLVAPGSSFNTPYSDHFRITTLPDKDTLNSVFERIDSLLDQHV